MTEGCGFGRYASVALLALASASLSFVYFPIRCEIGVAEALAARRYC